MWSCLLWLSVGFVAGVVAILAAEVLVVYVVINRLQHKTKQHQEKEAIQKSKEIESKPDLHPRQALEFASIKEVCSTYVFISNVFLQFLVVKLSPAFLLVVSFLPLKLNNNY